MELLELVEAYKELGYGGCLIIIIYLVVRHFLKENKKCWEKYEKQLVTHKKEITDITHKMFDVITSNTTANVALTKSIDSLGNRLGQ